MRKLLRTASFLLASLGIAAVAMLGATPVHAGVEDYEYDAWHVNFEVTTTEGGRSSARVTETLTPHFPMIDQNRGIVRGIPLDYQGFSIDPTGFTVTDADGTAIPFEVEDENGFRVLLIGDDTFVHGPQTYVIGYTISDVVLARDDAAADELYWDLLDFEHLQPIAQFSADIVFAPELLTALNGNMRCYVGPAKSTDECSLSGEGTKEDPISVSGISLAAQEGLTVAIGMDQGTVTQPPQRLPNFALETLPMLVGGAGLASGVGGAFVVSRFRSRRRNDRGTVIAQYDVPADLPPLLAAPIVGGPVREPVTAQIVHLAVSGVTQLAEDEAPGKKKRKPKLAQLVRVVDPGLATDELDRLALDAIAPGAQAGSSVALPQQSDAFATRMTALTAAGKQAAFDRGYLEKARAPGARALGIASLVIAIALAGLGVTGLALRDSALPLVFIVAALLTGVLAVNALAKHQVHTRLGAETREYLEGVRLFIRVAEADRIRTLQSHSGAERREVDGVAVIHLYERLLPYAMLFNLEKEWGGVLQARYSAEPGYEPHWYPGIGVYGFAGLTDTLERYTDSITSSVTYTSSSSGGSTGGGFAGGGGGGGFSGGR